MYGEATSGFELDVKGAFELPIFQRQLQTGKLRGQGTGNVRLNFSLQFLPRRCFEWQHRRIGGIGDEATSGLGLNTIGEMRDQAFEVHGT